MGVAGRISALLIALGGGMLVTHPAAAVDPLNPYAPCSVFDRGPCNPSFCSVFSRRPCIPVYPPLGQGLRVTIASNAENGHAPEGSINSIQDLYAALRTCWEPPPLNEAI